MRGKRCFTAGVVLAHKISTLLYCFDEADRVLLMSAPPGTVVEDRRVSVSRPRQFDDPRLAPVIAEIHGHLVKEVEKVVAREIGG